MAALIRTVGQKLELSNKTLIHTSNGDYLFDKSIPAFDMPLGTEPREYAMVQDAFVVDGNDAGYSASSAISMAQKFNGLKYIPTHVEVLKSGFAIPTPSRFMPHLRNVNDALKGRGVLYDASGNLIEGERLNQYANRMNHNCWVWLNAGFQKGNGFKGLELVTISGLDDKGEPITNAVPLEDCLEENCWADAESVNAQGFPTKKSKTDNYEPGKNFYSWYPRPGAVVRFVADSGGAYLSCDGDPGNRYDSLGVRFVARKN